MQDAHEGIRPTDLTITPEMVEEKCSKDQAKLYKLILYQTKCVYLAYSIIKKSQF